MWVWTYSIWMKHNASLALAGPQSALKKQKRKKNGESGFTEELYIIQNQSSVRYISYSAGAA